MNRGTCNVLAAAAAVLALSACALRLGGPKPEQYQTIALRAAAGAPADNVGARLRAAEAGIVLLSAEQDSAWFARVADAAGLELSGPGRTSGQGMAFLTDLEILGDTSLVLSVTGGGMVHMHDALYKIDDRRNIDLMMIRFDAADIRAAVSTLLAYFATDVPPDAAVVVALDGPTPQLADSAAVLMRAHLASARECRDADDLPGAAPVRLLYGPSARVSCLSARPFEGGAAGISARIQVER